MEQKPHRACEWTKSNKNKKKLESRHKIDQEFYCSI